MSDFDDDVDDDLPSVSLSQSTGEKSELEMPPASEVASLRAREEAAERALKDLRESYATPRVVSWSRSASQGSSSEEGEAALSAAVSALQVTDAQPGARDASADRLQLLVAMREHLPEDRAFLDAYIQVLKDRPEAVAAVTEKLLQGISAALTSGYTISITGASAFLLCVSLSSTRALRARRALHALLDMSDHTHVLTKAVLAAADGDAELLLASHDAVRSGAGGGADKLADALLAHAMTETLPRDEQEMRDMSIDPPSPLSPESISSIRASWRKLPPRTQLLLLRCAGRALAAQGAYRTQTQETLETHETHGTPEMERTQELGAGDTGAGEVESGAALLAALAQPLPRASAFHLERQQVLTNVSKLQLLFRARFNPECENEPENLDYTEFDTKTTPIKEPIKLETMKIEKEKLEATPVKKEKQMKMDSFVTQSPFKQTPLKEEMKMKEVKQEMKMKEVKQEMKMKEVKQEMKMKEVKQEMKMKEVKQEMTEEMKMKEMKETEDGERSPERKRMRRERRAVLKITFKDKSKYK